MIMLKSTHEKIVKNLEEERQISMRTIDQQLETVTIMADQIRQMDQLIFQMSQCTSWSEMRPLFNKLQQGQESRQRNESNRITDIMRLELLPIYIRKDDK